MTPRIRAFLLAATSVTGVFVLCASAEPENPPAAAAGAPYPIDLATTLQLAGARSVDVQIARTQLAAAEANVTSAFSQLIPSLSATAGVRRHAGLTQDVVGNVIEADKDLRGIAGGVDLQVELGQGLYGALAARQARTAAGQGLETARQDAVVRAAEAYFDLLTAQASEAVAAEALSISQDYESQLHRAVEAGIALKGEELRVGVQTRRNRLALQQASERRQLLAARLVEALRLEPGVALVARDSELAPLSLADASRDVATLVSEALAARPELHEAQALVRAADEARKGAVYGPLVPTLLGQAAFGTIDGGRDGGPTNGGGARDYVAAIGWRFGPGGILDLGRMRLARVRLQEAGWKLEQLKDEIGRQVAEARVGVLSKQEQLETARAALDTAREALQLARGRKQFEVGDVLENILAEQDQTRSRQDFVRVLGEYDKAQYALARALGRLGSAASPKGPVGGP